MRILTPVLGLAAAFFTAVLGVQEVMEERANGTPGEDVVGSTLLVVAIVFLTGSALVVRRPWAAAVVFGLAVPISAPWDWPAHYLFSLPALVLVVMSLVAWVRTRSVPTGA